MTDLHAALRTEVIDSAHSGAGVEFVVVRLQHSKDDVRFSLHARPSSWSTAGPQTTDVLGMIGFHRSRCAFVSGGECYGRAVDAEFDVQLFATAFTATYTAIDSARRHLEQCGIFLSFNEGWGYFHGKPSTPHKRPTHQSSGDGHTAAKSERMKDSADDVFQYVFTWIVGDGQKGWTTHYFPKHSPLTPEIDRAIDYLGLHHFPNCPEFEFESCHWRFTPWQQDGDSIFDGNADIAHRWFGAHAQHFAPGLEQLLAAQAAMRPFNLTIIPDQRSASQQRQQRTVTTPSRGSAQSKAPRSASAQTAATRDYEYDVAISFAGAERPLAEQLATLARGAGISVFYDNFFPEKLWGKNLPVFFEEVFREKARYCVILVSAAYLDRDWTNFELQHAVARAIQEKGSDYILPVKIDDVSLPGVPPTVGYLSLEQYPVEELADLLLSKLRRP